MLPCKSTAKEVSVQWPHQGISFTDLKVRTTVHVFITDSGSERVSKYIWTLYSNSFVFLVKRRKKF